MNPSFPESLRRVIAWLAIPLQVLGWLIYMSLPFLILSLTQVISQPDALRIFSVKIINDLLSIIFFYLNLTVLTPHILKHRGGTLFGLVFGGLLMVLYTVDALYYRLYLRDALADIARHLPGDAALRMDLRWGIPSPILLVSFLSLLLLTSVSSGLAIYRDRAQYVMSSQQMVIEKQDAELSMLKLQISPHFLFNTLNNLRWLARKKSDLTEDALLRLSDMMRYMIYQVDEGPVPLAKEIAYLEHYIELQKMRLSANNHLTISIQASDRQVLIEPLLFIHFVENAFKHGIHALDYSPITIQLTFQDGVLRFQTSNCIFHDEAASADSGIGIKNIERRLALHYPNRHRLRIYQQNGLFCIELMIELEPVSQSTLP